MGINNNQSNNTNKPENSKHTDSSSSIINKKMGKERNFIVNRTSSNILEQGTDFSAMEYTYSRRTPKPDIINEILKRLEKIDSKLEKMDMKIDNMDERITNIELVQKVQ
jgi:tetrahydromethanopterin S-methyltransferase subunit G